MVFVLKSDGRILFLFKMSWVFPVISLKADWSGGALPLWTGDNPALSVEGQGDRAEYPALPHNRHIEAVSQSKEMQPQGAQGYKKTPQTSSPLFCWT